VDQFLVLTGIQLFFGEVNSEKYSSDYLEKVTGFIRLATH